MAAAQGKIIITCAVTGPIHTPSMSPHPPITPKEFQPAWEKPSLAGSDERIFKNTFKDIELILRSCADNDTRFEIECYDIGHLYTAAHFVDRGLLRPPLFIQSVFGIRGGIGPHPEDVLHMKRTADRLFGDAYYWSVLGAGRNQMFIA